MAAVETDHGDVCDGRFCPRRELGAGGGAWATSLLENLDRRDLLLKDPSPIKQELLLRNRPHTSYSNPPPLKTCRSCLEVRSSHPRPSAWPLSRQRWRQPLTSSGGMNILPRHQSLLTSTG